MHNLGFDNIRNLALVSASLVLALHTHEGSAQTIHRQTVNPGATKVFGDEFNRLSLWNGKSGSWDTEFWYDRLHGNGDTIQGEQQWYVNANFARTKSVRPWKVANGALLLTADRAAENVEHYIDGYEYTSGEVNSYYSFNRQYGYFEIRCKLPKGQGIGSAFSLLAENGAATPEIDVFNVDGRDPRILYVSAHVTADGKEVNYGTAVAVADTSKAFHTYAVDLEPDSVTWYFDGRQVYQISNNGGFATPMYMEASLPLGSREERVDRATPFPSAVKIDFIRVYSAKP